MKEKRIPFTIEKWITDKNQKVVTRNNKSVKILSISGRTRPIAAFVGEEDLLVSYYSNGKRSLECDTMNDLYIVQEEKEEEMSEFAKCIKAQIVDAYNSKYLDITDNWIRELEKDFINLARKELNIPNNEEMLRTLRTEYEKGRADVLKDMPKWKPIYQEKWPNASPRFEISKEFLFDWKLSKCINIYDLEKLPHEE